MNFSCQIELALKDREAACTKTVTNLKTEPFKTFIFSILSVQLAMPKAADTVMENRAETMDTLASLVPAIKPKLHPAIIRRRQVRMEKVVSKYTKQRRRVLEEVVHRAICLLDM